MSRRVVVTGLGLLSPLGIGTEENWQGLTEGHNGAGPITRFDTSEFAVKIACQMEGFDPLDWFSTKEARKFDPFVHYAVAASEMALESSGFEITDENADRVGVVVGSGIGGFQTIEYNNRVLFERGPRRVSPFFIPGAIVNMGSGLISIRTGAKGPNMATVTACSTSAHAIGDATLYIRHGYADVIIAGGAEAAITPIAVAGFSNMRALSTRNDDPKRASRPWDRDRDGFVMGEGAGMVILEEYEHARRRGAPILGEVLGFGMSGDAHHISAPSPDGDGAIRVMRAALDDARVDPDRVDYVNAHGTSTPAGDPIEVVAVKEVFGEHSRKVLVASTKSMTGHLLGAAGAYEFGVALLLSLIHISEPTRRRDSSRMPSSA